MGAATSEEVLLQIKEKLDKVGDQVREAAEKAVAESLTKAGMTAEFKQKCDELLTEMNQLKVQVIEVEQKQVKAANSLIKTFGNPNELAEALEKQKADLTDFIENKGRQKQIDIPISRKALTNTGLTGTALTYPGDQVLASPMLPLQRRLTVRQLLAQGSTSSAVIWYQKETGFTNNANMVSEGSLKPKSELTFDLVMAPVRTIAHLFDVSLQMLADVPYMQSYIGTRGNYGLKIKEEDELLTGSGVGQNLNGLYTQATAYSAPAGATINGQPAGGANETDLDKLRLAQLQVALAFAESTGFVLHPTDWASIELLKDTTGQYIFTNPQRTTSPVMWGLPVVATPAMTQGRFLTGDFAQYAQVFDREDANIAISFENKDNFERNMATIRVEERLVLAVYRPEAFVKGVLESAS